MNCVSKEYGILNKNGAGAMTTAKNAVFNGLYLKIVVYWGYDVWWWQGIKIWWRGRQGIKIWWRGSLLGVG